MPPKRPPVTPSPHRFAPRRLNDEVHQHQPQNGLTTPAAHHNSVNAVSERQGKPSQFSNTPRFSHKARPKESDDQAATPSASILRKPHSLRKKQSEVIEDASQEDVAEAVQSVERADESLHDTHVATEPSEALHSASEFERRTGPFVAPFKRRKLSDAGLQDDPPAIRPPKFLSKPMQHSSLFEPQTDEAASPTLRLRPTFVIPPPMSESTGGHVKPLPDAFSPHRKGQKYIAGGMADTMRNWILSLTYTNTTTSGDSHTSHRSGSTHFKVTKLVDHDGTSAEESNRTGWSLLEGTFIDSDGSRTAQKVMCTAQSSKWRSSVITTGSILQVASPFWHTDVQGEDWLVVIDWTPT